jgi:hypothetical protein
MYSCRLKYYYDFIIRYQLVLKLNKSHKLQLPAFSKCIIYADKAISNNLIYNAMSQDLLNYRLDLGSSILLQLKNKSFAYNNSLLTLKITIRKTILYNWLDFIKLNNDIIEISYNSNCLFFYLLNDNNNLFFKNFKTKIILVFSLPYPSYNKLLISYYKLSI